MLMEGKISEGAPSRKMIVWSVLNLMNWGGSHKSVKCNYVRFHFPLVFFFLNAFDLRSE